MISFFKLIAILEGVSYILLLFVAVPIKYLQGDPQYVKMLGMPHGVLFMAYLVLAFVVFKDLKWSNKTLVYVLIASVIPFATFYVERKYIK